MFSENGISGAKGGSLGHNMLVVLARVVSRGYRFARRDVRIHATFVPVNCVERRDTGGR